MEMLRINKVDARISISTTQTRMIISQTPDGFEMNIKHPRIEMHTEQGQIRIDQQQCFNESGLMDNRTLIRDYAERGKRAALEAIGEIAAEGDMLSDIKGGYDAIAHIALNKSRQRLDYNYGVMPKSRPEIDFVGGNVDIRVEEGYVEIFASPQKPQIEVEPGGVHIRVEQYPQISFEYVGTKLDEKI